MASGLVAEEYGDSDSSHSSYSDDPKMISSQPREGEACADAASNQGGEKVPVSEHARAPDLVPSSIGEEKSLSALEGAGKTNLQPTSEHLLPSIIDKRAPAMSCAHETEVTAAAPAVVAELDVNDRRNKRRKKKSKRGRGALELLGIFTEGDAGEIPEELLEELDKCGSNGVSLVQVDARTHTGGGGVGVSDEAIAAVAERAEVRARTVSRPISRAQKRTHHIMSLAAQVSSNGGFRSAPADPGRQDGHCDLKNKKF